MRETNRPLFGAGINIGLASNSFDYSSFMEIFTFSGTSSNDVSAAVARAAEDLQKALGTGRKVVSLSHNVILNDDRKFEATILAALVEVLCVIHSFADT